MIFRALSESDIAQLPEYSGTKYFLLVKGGINQKKMRDVWINAFVMFQDCYSKFIWVKTLSSMTRTEVEKAFDDIFKEVPKPLFTEMQTGKHHCVRFHT